MAGQGPSRSFLVFYVIVVIGVGYFVLLAAGAFSEDDPPPIYSAPTARPATQPDALDQMVIAFDGNWTRSQIRTRVDKALTLYGEPTTDEMRSRAGSSLVTLRRELGVPEMEILELMLCSPVVADHMSFPEAAGLAAGFASAGDSC